MSGIYISREAAIKAMDEDRKNYHGFMAEDQFIHEAAIEVLKKVPAADVRPVVLCKDCRHWDIDEIPKYARENEHFCPMVTLTTREDWFCADGVKREES